MERRIPGAVGWSVPIGECPRKPAVTGFRAYCPPGWLLLELPTALLLAVFVGTGWLGYAQPRPPAERPAQVVIAPADAAQTER
ncbi:hypothetical protein [Nocardia transvalensis]|uniref:hypothetical protein n=1 Tax=Nocardia transvalensis TaxID=37333 RepID=UPI001894A268|nr:hypothetical protein [Nocardia transvalensis]MBF6331311.1 hypothetical protein [Nocardia transvalensis]